MFYHTITSIAPPEPWLIMAILLIITMLHGAAAAADEALSRAKTETEHVTEQLKASQEENAPLQLSLSLVHAFEVLSHAQTNAFEALSCAQADAFEALSRAQTDWNEAFSRAQIDTDEALSRAKNETEHVTEQLKTCQEERAALQLSLSYAKLDEEDVKSAEKKTKRVMKLLRSREAESGELHLRATRAQDETERVTEQLQYCDDEIKELRLEVERVQSTAKDAISRAEAKTAHVTTHLNTSQETVAKQQTTMERLLQDNKAMKDQVGGNGKTLQAYEIQTKNLKASLAAAKEENEKKPAASTAELEEIESLNKINANLQKNLGILYNKSKISKQEIDDAKAELKKQNGEVLRLEKLLLTR